MEQDLRRISGTNQEILWFRLVMEDTHCSVATTSFGAGGQDAWLVKTDAAGTMQWNKTYGGTGTETAIYLIQTSDGGYALTGTEHHHLALAVRMFILSRLMHRAIRCGKEPTEE